MTTRPGFEVYAAQADVLGEGPVWSAGEAALYWVDIAQRTVYRRSPSEARSQSWALPDYPGCLAELTPGAIAVAAGAGVQRLSLSSGELDLLCRSPARRPGTRFNDGKVDPWGRLWVGTMQNNYGSDGCVIPIERSDGALYRFDAEGGVETVEEDIGVPNSLAWSPDTKRFYFADSLLGMIFAYDFDADSGTLSNKRPFFEASDMGIPDGSAVDSDGCLWNARWGGGAIVRITPRGKVDRRVEMPVPNPTSCIFGGPHFDILFVTSAGHGLSLNQLETYPLSGSVFALSGLGKGLAVPPFSK